MLWTNESFVEMTVNIPHNLFKDNIYNPESLQKVRGYAEEAVLDIKDGEIIQFERFGFVRIEKTDGKITGYMAHK